MAYDLSDQLQAGVVYTYDENFESRVSAEIKVRFGSDTKSLSKIIGFPVLQGLSDNPRNRNIRVANSCGSIFPEDCSGDFIGGFDQQRAPGAPGQGDGTGGDAA